MIVDYLKNWGNYFTNPVWETIFAELTALNEKTPEMEKKIRGDDIILKVFSYTTISPRDEQAELESHRRYLDIHTSIINAERIDWFPVASLKVIKPYNGMEDAIYYARREPADASIVMRPGLFALFSPNDAHMPRLHMAGKPAAVKKAVLKIRFDPPI
jgi:YhcH/YjgK/YiaL family protein